MSDVTIYTLAKELNMTASMVSRAFNPEAKISEEKRKTVLAAAKKYNFSPNRMASRLSMRTVQIGIVINARFAAGADKMVSGIESAYEKLKDYKVKYDIVRMNPIENKSEDYVKELNKLKKYDGVILTGMSSAKYTGMINGLYKENPNIVQVQAINNEANYLFASKHDEEIASKLAAEFLYNCIKRSERKNILLFTGEKESAVHASAGAAFCRECNEYGLKILDCIDMKDNEEYFRGIIPDVFRKYGEEADGIYITSGISSALCEYMDENKIDLPFVGFDTYEEIKKYMEKGIVSSTIAQNVSKQMETAFEMLVEHIITGRVYSKIVHTDVQLVLKSNMHQFE